MALYSFIHPFIQPHLWNPSLLCSSLEGSLKAKQKFKTHYSVRFILQQGCCTSLLRCGKQGYGTVKFREEFMGDLKPQEMEGVVGACPAEKTKGDRASRGHVRLRIQLAKCSV